MSLLCIYHGGCTDGVAAAWVVWKETAANHFLPGVYQAEPDYDLIRQYDNLLIVDFSYKRAIMEKLAAITKVTVWDHHKTAKEDLMSLTDEGKIKSVFADDKCGALLTWSMFRGDEEPPRLLREIDAQDRWLPTRNAPLIISLRSHPHAPDDEMSWDSLMQLWSGFMTDEGYQRLKRDGDAIYRYYSERVAETVKHAKPFFLGGKEFNIVNAPYYLASDVAGIIADPYGAAWWMNKDGTITFSLRARDDSVDVSSIAKIFGGGGHKGAAGFKLSVNDGAAMLAAIAASSSGHLDT